MRTRCGKLTTSLILVLILTGLTMSPVRAKDSEYDAVVKHLKIRYQAKKQHIPFLGLARFAVKLVRPAGVKSFDIAIFEDLRFDTPERGRELQRSLATMFSADWSPVVHVGSLNGDQSFVYARDNGGTIKLIIVNIEADQATVIRAKISPEKLSEFIQDPRILGVSVSP
jgi:hypothetical protein